MHWAQQAYASCRHVLPLIGIRERCEAVLLDHGDAELVVKINGVGSGKETGEQPLNSMGRSVDIDLRVFKTKI